MTRVFTDDFSGTSLDTTKWVGQWNTDYRQTFAGGIMTVPGHSDKGSYSSGLKTLSPFQFIGKKINIKTRIALTETPGSSWAVGIQSSDNAGVLSNNYYFTLEAGYYFNTRGSGCGMFINARYNNAPSFPLVNSGWGGINLYGVDTSLNASQGTYMVLEIVIETDGTVKYYIDTVLKATHPQTIPLNSYFCYLTPGIHDAGRYHLVDYSYIDVDNNINIISTAKSIVVSKNTSNTSINFNKVVQSNFIRVGHPYSYLKNIESNILVQYITNTPTSGYIGTSDFWLQKINISSPIIFKGISLRAFQNDQNFSKFTIAIRKNSCLGEILTIKEFSASGLPRWTEMPTYTYFEFDSLIINDPLIDYFIEVKPLNGHGTYAMICDVEYLQGKTTGNLWDINSSTPTSPSRNLEYDLLFKIHGNNYIPLVPASFDGENYGAQYLGTERYYSQEFNLSSPTIINGSSFKISREDINATSLKISLIEDSITGNVIKTETFNVSSMPLNGGRDSFVPFDFITPFTISNISKKYFIEIKPLNGDHELGFLIGYDDTTINGSGKLWEKMGSSPYINKPTDNINFKIYGDAYISPPININGINKNLSLYKNTSFLTIGFIKLAALQNIYLNSNSIIVNSSVRKNISNNILNYTLNNSLLSYRINKQNVNLDLYKYKENLKLSQSHLGNVNYLNPYLNTNERDVYLGPRYQHFFGGSPQGTSENISIKHSGFD